MSTRVPKFITSRHTNWQNCQPFVKC